MDTRLTRVVRHFLHDIELIQSLQALGAQVRILYLQQHPVQELSVVRGGVAGFLHDDRVQHCLQQLLEARLGDVMSTSATNRCLNLRLMILHSFSIELNSGE